MLSWIFRNRARLEVIYGRAACPRLEGARFQGSAGETSGHARPAEAPRPGQVQRTASRRVVVRPMPRRVR